MHEAVDGGLRGIPGAPGRYTGTMTLEGETIEIRQGDLYLREPDGTSRRLRHRLRHSPAGLDWGHGGSGPARAPVGSTAERVVPERVGAADIDLCNFRVYGTNSKTGDFFLAGDLNVTPMSAGGTHGVDGWGGWAAPFCALKLPPLEMYEWQFPFRYLQMEYATDTAAPGRWRGAPAHPKRPPRHDAVPFNGNTPG